MTKDNAFKDAPRYRTVTISTDTADGIDIVAAKLEKQFGFRPTHTQTIKYLLSKEGEV